MKTIRLGVLGAGLAVKHLHLPALKALPNCFEIVSICDHNWANAEALAGLLDLHPTITDSWVDFFADSQIEAVLISLPIQRNAEAIQAAVAAGKHVICEKPLAANLPQAEALVAACQHAPVKILIAENFHYRDDLKQARAWMDAGAIGDLVLIELRATFWSDPDQGFGATPWRHDHQYRGAVLADAGVHQAALLRELGGPIESAHAFIKDVHPVLRGPDTMVLNLRFASGVLGSLCFSGAVKTENPCFDWTVVHGTHGSITIRGDQTTLYRADGTIEHYQAQDLRGYISEFRNFYAAIVENEPIVASLATALADWRLIMRAIDAAESNSVQQIDPIVPLASLNDLPN
ncbi:MAG TPA: gfo/Idh/MocA family oxidoreductase [Herpetosiphon sp.]|uniref:Oxidoreductase domain protein n=1 Tax=Herpetosiphon aurantiacus (strain ATCC 23779 / DSM 785 / 114-95) TaxID=316274 RepID=A9AWY4_HERA2|nr:Gfo/Idh/MocA family oxidoreductase [Herpetosiphon sp.]ABX03385.1 oxidoreductase domain protein [Herpetosiphon aurantiacus DSM 785]HBW50540.1 gfo/Idh/MocA family oxidoreductase [Herpetosiphon sp.]